MRKNKEYVLNGDKESDEFPILRVIIDGEIFDVADFSGGDLDHDDAWTIAEEIVSTMNR